jgi:putative ABC transport system substrate-binding protein
MHRRDFLNLAGLAVPAVAGMRSARAQPVAAKRVGMLLLRIPEAEILRTVLQNGLRAAGYVEGQTIRYDVGSVEGGGLGELPKLAAELVAVKPDVIVALYTPCVKAAQQATRDIPIVTVAGDLVGSGIVQSLNRPGGNVTGVSMIAAELHGKCVELFRDMLPSIRRVGLLANDGDPFKILIHEQVMAGGRATGLEIAPVVMVRQQSEIDSALGTMKGRDAGGIVVQGSLASKGVAELFLKHRLPAATFSRAFVESGGLIGYGADTPELFRTIPTFVRRILQGERPADMPVEQPTKFDLAVNLKTAKTLGIAVTESFLLRANIVIE